MAISSVFFFPLHQSPNHCSNSLTEEGSFGVLSRRIEQDSSATSALTSERGGSPAGSPDEGRHRKANPRGRTGMVDLKAFLCGG